MPGVDQVGELPLEEIVETASQQAVVLARERWILRDATWPLGPDGPVPEPHGGGVLLGALASGTGTAALILLAARRPAPRRPLGVTGAYAGAGALRPARAWGAYGKPGRTCPTYRFETIRFGSPRRTSGRRRDARQPTDSSRVGTTDEVCRRVGATDELSQPPCEAGSGHRAVESEIL